MAEAVTTGESPIGKPSFLQSQWLAGIFLVVVVVLVYQPVWHAGFIWDDDAYVTNNVTLRSLHGLWRIWFEIGAVPQYYPLVHTTFWLEYHLWGLNACGYHLVNLVLHAFGAILLWQILIRLQLPGAWLVAAIFALHPLQVESVAWITERKNVLSAVFYFASALVYLLFAGLPDKEKQIKRSWRLYFCALGLFIGALLSKTVACSLPAALLLVIWWKKGKLLWKDILPLLPFFIIGIALGFLTAWIEKNHVGAQGADWSLTPGQRLLIAGRALWFYADKLIWPVNLIFNYPRWEIETTIWWQWLFPIAAVGVIIALWFLRHRIGRGPLVGVLFFCGTLFPALGFINVYPMRYSFVADHFQYIACIGLIAPASVGIMIALHKHKTTRFAVCGIMLSSLMAMTFCQSRIYKGKKTLWEVTIQRNPNSWMAYENLAVFLFHSGRVDDSIAYLRKAFKIHPNSTRLLYDLGFVLLRTGHVQEAIDYFQKALELNPNLPEVHYNLGVAFVQTGEITNAIDHFWRAVEIKPDYAEAHRSLGWALAQVGQRTEAIKEYREALRLNPNDSISAELLQELK